MNEAHDMAVAALAAPLDPGVYLPSIIVACAMMAVLGAAVLWVTR